jgi:hypothetical protein
MDIKLIATDVDGTLVADDHLTIPRINIEAFQEAKARGIITVISTGRPFSLAKRENDALQGVDYMIVSNGAAVIDMKTNKVINSCYLSLESSKKIIEIFEKYPLVYEIYADCKGFITQYTYDHYFEGTLPEIFMREYRSLMELCDSPWDVIRKFNVEKINVDYMPQECVEELQEELSHIPGLVYSAGFEGNMEITASGADKGRALGWLCERIGINKENVMAFGDSGNDVTMLKSAEISYALVSGNQLAKKAAKFTTKSSNEDGGVGEIIKEYLTNFAK